MSRFSKLINVFVFLAIAITAIAIILALTELPRIDRTINVNGQAVDLTNAKSIMIESQEGVQYFDADSISGAVTVTKSTVTVTIWMKP